MCKCNPAAWFRRYTDSTALHTQIVKAGNIRLCCLRSVNPPCWSRQACRAPPCCRLSAAVWEKLLEAAEWESAGEHPREHQLSAQAPAGRPANTCTQKAFFMHMCTVPCVTAMIKFYKRISCFRQIQKHFRWIVLAQFPLSQLSTEIYNQYNYILLSTKRKKHRRLFCHLQPVHWYTCSVRASELFSEPSNTATPGWLLSEATWTTNIPAPSRQDNAGDRIHFCVQECTQVHIKSWLNTLKQWK